jgi:hypothetical protein
MQDSFVFHRRLDRELPRASRAEGVWIYDAGGGIGTGQKQLEALSEI